ncbi:Phage-related protein, tail component [Lysobacter sp. yr284]|uniref:tail assembly protein n=1 Tax=Lysobacter sp. yr284 TaxID=1761791 RepID=UPI000898CEC3|nr:tail assembly protein [Lysobacter sp. yr284]SDZ17443.1 Phage-related protein, tail component [Lysobacter sp. yr284]
MTDKLRTIRLYGSLGARFGREYRMVVSNAAEAIQALSIQIPGFRAYLQEAKARGLGFAVFLGRRNLAESQLNDPPGDQAIRIAPILIGSKRGGLVQIIAGAALIAAGYALAPFTGGASLMLGKFGWSMIAGGVVQLLSPQPKGLNTRERPENQPSYMFSGIVNTQAQGAAVPLLYGPGHDGKGVWTGGAILSAGIYAEDQQ